MTSISPTALITATKVAHKLVDQRLQLEATDDDVAVVWEGYDYYVSHRVAPASAWPFETRRARELARTSPELQAMLALPARVALRRTCYRGAIRI